MTILNLTQHTSTTEQIEAGVVDLAGQDLEELKEALNFLSSPTQENIMARACKIAGIATRLGFKKAMIGGAPYLMGPLEKFLADGNIEPLYAFSERVSVETVFLDGSVVKTNVFKHKCFIRGTFFSNFVQPLK